MNRIPFITIIILNVILAGCLSSTGSTDIPPRDDVPGTQDYGDWSQASPDHPFKLNPEMIPAGMDWIIIEVDSENLQLITLENNFRFDFENPAIAPELIGACPIFSVGVQGSNASFATSPFIVPERAFPGQVEIGPQPEFGVGLGQLSFQEHIYTTGIQVGHKGGFTTPIGSENGSTFIAFGLANLESWLEAGVQLDVATDENESFRFRIVHAGQAHCNIDLVEYDGGDFVRTSAFTNADGIYSRPSIKDGFVAYIAYAADISRTMEIRNPSGTIEWSDEYESPIDQRKAEAKGLTYCSPEIGAWELQFPILQGTDHRIVYANSMILDVPTELFSAMPCFIQDRLDDE